MTPTLDKNQDLACFAPCVRGAGLLMILPVVAGRAPVGGRPAHLAAAKRFADDFKPSVKQKINLTRCEIFRGKVSRRKTRNQNNRLEERTPPAPNS
jgi:hypothetical protein